MKIIKSVELSNKHQYQGIKELASRALQSVRYIRWDYFIFLQILKNQNKSSTRLNCYVNVVPFSDTVNLFESADSLCSLSQSAFGC